MHQARLAGESFFKRMVLTSMGLGSLVECELEENEERGKPCPFLRAMIRAFCLWKLMAFSIQALRVVGTFSMEEIMVASWISNPSVKCLHIAGVSPALNCATKYWNLERYVWNLSSF